MEERLDINAGKPEEITVTDTADNGKIENVHIAPVGSFVGSDSEGNPVPESITAESLQALADKLNEAGEEVLCDVDHKASKPGLDRDTRSAGWFRRFIVDPIKGLFATLSLTKHGKELLENREYRYISPTFSLDEEGRPVGLHTASLTNTPAFAGYINPILNQESKPLQEKEVENMTKDELVELIKDTVKNMDSAEESSEVKEETKEETKEEETVSEDVEAQNGCSDVEEEVKNETAEPEETSEKETEEKPEEEEKKEEVIKIEALNASPSALKGVTEDGWQNLHGDAFWKWLREHPEAV